MVATQIFFMFTPNLGEDEPILTSIFFKWVGSTTNQKCFGLMFFAVASLFLSSAMDLRTEDVTQLWKKSVEVKKVKDLSYVTKGEPVK